MSTTPRPGDIFLEHDKDLIDKIIQFGQHIRRGPKQSYWNHAGVIVEAGDGVAARVIEATASGVVSDFLAASGRGETCIIPVEPEEARNRVVQFATAREGRKYGFTEIACIVLTLITGTHFRFGLSGQYICSGLVACSLEFAGIDMGDDPEWTLPADLSVLGFGTPVVPMEGTP